MRDTAWSIGDESPRGSRRLRGWAGLAALAAAFLGILFLRRGQQLVSPQVWNEDGMPILHDLLDRGIGSMLDPVSGYMLLAPKVISWLALQMSITLYPLLATLLAWAFSVGVLLAIARHPSRLAGGAWLSLCVLLVPTDPEAFGIPLYSLWWSGLLLFVAIFWDEQAGHLPLRLAGTVCGGLSSPLVVLAAPAYWARVCQHPRLWREWVLAVVATACAAVQLSLLLAHRIGGSFTMTARTIPKVVTKFFGHFAVGELPLLCKAAAPVGFAVCALVAVVLWQRRRETVTWFLGYLLLGSIALSLVRVPVAVIHPVLAGPRYFVFPFIVLSWVLLQAACRPEGPGWLQWATRGVLVLAALNALPHFSRTHDDLDWRGHLASSIHFDRYDVPVECDGAACRRWSMPVAGERTAAALARDPFAAWTRAAATYPYTARNFVAAAKRPTVASRGDMDAGDWEPVNAEDVPAGLVALRSTGASRPRRLSCTVTRGAAMLFRSSPEARGLRVTIAGADRSFAPALPPTTPWRWLVFSSRQLPETFTVVIEDHGTDPGQWAELVFAP